MSYPPPYQSPSPYQSPYQPVAPLKRGNGFGVTALVLGLVGLALFSWFPFVNIFTGGLIGLTAIVFGIVGLVTARSRDGAGAGSGGTGLVLGFATILVVIIVNVWIVKWIEGTSDELQDEYMTECTADGTLTEEECAEVWNF